MTKFPHDQFAKEYFKELLSPLGEVETSKDVSAEVREIDIWFQPTSLLPEYVEDLGLLGKMTATVAAIEPFRNAVNTEEIFSCVVKLLNTRAELLRRANREEQRLESQQLPKLWILTPTASEALLSSFNFQVPEELEGWGRGVYFLSEVWRVGLIAIHQLPNVPETMWLRILGKGRVQQGAIAELTRLPVDSPLRASALELLYTLQANLQANLAASVAGNEEDKELVMAIVPLFQQKLAAATQQGREEGREEGQRLILENFLQVRFGELDSQTMAFVSSVSALPVGEFTMLLVQLSTLPIDLPDRQQVQILLAENVLRKRFGQLDDRTVNLIPNLLALSAENLSLLLSQLPELSLEELISRLENCSA
jgi:hypothetical protein